jgi:hypothetical protein
VPVRRQANCLIGNGIDEHRQWSPEAVSTGANVIKMTVGRLSGVGGAWHPGLDSFPHGHGIPTGPIFNSKNNKFY